MAATAPRNPDLDLLAAEIERDPVFFAREILGHDYWATQEAIARAVARPRAKVAVKACHGSSKTFTAADLVQWWTVTGGIVVTTASTWEQVKRLLWGEVHKSYAASRYPLGGELLQTELKFAPDCYAIGLSTNEGVRFQGFHGRVFVVIDEAPGVRPEIWEAIEGIRAGGDVRVLALGNPTVRGGPFYDAFTTDRHEWATFTIDAFDTPNLAGLTLDDLSALSDEELDHNVRPYLVTRRWVLEKFRAWGESSPLWKARVRGQFPDTSEDAVIPLSWVEQAHQRWREWDAAGRPGGFSCVGVDVGESGDSTVLALRHDDVIAELRYAPHGDTMDTVGRVVAVLQRHGGEAVVDAIGIGAGVVARLRELALPVVAFNASMKSVHLDRTGELGFANKRAEAWWSLRELLDPSGGEAIALPPDDRLTAELTCPGWRMLSGGRVLVEAKADIRKRLGRSTDAADAVVMAFAGRTVGFGAVLDYLTETTSDCPACGSPIYDPSGGADSTVRCPRCGSLRSG